MRLILCLLAATAVGGCAGASVVPLANDTIQITSAAAPVCGMTGAQQVAAKRAAVETLRRGFDSYIVVDGHYRNNVRVIGHTPVVANTYGTASGTAYGGIVNVQGQSTTYVTGGDPIVGGTHNQALTIRMFKADDPAAANAIDARQTLGPEWREAVDSRRTTCL